MSRPRRKYDSSSRRAKAEQTTSRIIRSAGELFIQQGYAGTSIREIAELADVSEETVYATFGSKSAVLMRWLDVQVVGDEESVALIERLWLDELRREPTLDGRLALLVEHGSIITSRAEPAMRVLRAAGQSDPELAQLLAQGQQRRRADNLHFLDLLIGDDQLRSTLDRDQAADWLWMITSDEVYGALVHDRGWTVDSYREWLVLTIRSTLFGS